MENTCTTSKNMPPKGTKGRPAKPANLPGENGDINTGTKITTPVSPTPTDPELVMPSPLPKLPDGNDSDNSFSEEDTFKILKKILLNQKVAEKKSDERQVKLTKAIRESRKALDTYKDTNDKAVTEVKLHAESTAKGLKELELKVNNLQANLDDAQMKIQATQELLNQTQNDLKIKSKTLDKLEKKFDKDEDELKRCLLLLDGVNERDHKKPIVVVQTLLTDLGVTYKDGDIKSAYRLGAIKTGISRPRTIKIQFTNTALKGSIFKNISKLKENVAWKGVHLNDALSPKEMQQAKDLRCIFAAGKAQGLDIKLKGNALIIDGMRLTHKDIDHLPYGLSMEAVKIIKVEDGYAFQSHYAYLSNMFKVDIAYEGITYKSAEHLYTAEFARHHDHQDLIQSIIDAEDGYAAKKLIKNLKGNETWDTTKYKVMRRIIALKFDQHDSIRDKLLSTTGTLYEATKDTDFGCGLTLGQNKDITWDSIKGENMLGKILCEYRDKYLGIDM